MKKCVVIIPALNEEKSLAAVIDTVPKTLFNGDVLLEIVVVNDGSTDSTEQIAIEHGASVIRHESPIGVGIAFSDGVREALKRRAEYVVNMMLMGR